LCESSTGVAVTNLGMKSPGDRHAAREVARSLAGADGFERSRRERKKDEMRFAHLKRRG
jgi:hypothetical protein